MCAPCAGEEADNEMKRYLKIIECKMKLKMEKPLNEHFLSKEYASAEA